MSGKPRPDPVIKSASQLRREARLASALRANLKRRKAAARNEEEVPRRADKPLTSGTP